MVITLLKRFSMAEAVMEQRSFFGLAEHLERISEMGDPLEVLEARNPEQHLDLEIKALRSCGVPLANIVLPVFALGFLVSCLTWYIALDVEHRAKRELRGMLMAMTRSGSLIEPGKFTHIQSRSYLNHILPLIVFPENFPCLW